MNLEDNVADAREVGRAKLEGVTTGVGDSEVDWQPAEYTMELDDAEQEEEEGHEKDDNVEDEEIIADEEQEDAQADRPLPDCTMGIDDAELEEEDGHEEEEHDDEEVIAREYQEDDEEKEVHLPVRNGEDQDITDTHSLGSAVDGRRVIKEGVKDPKGSADVTTQNMVDTVEHSVNTPIGYDCAMLPCQESLHVKGTSHEGI
ncbi:hypothetical protein R1sor_000948 [Riccia sorocarpa]|uniref:Uncharacterized protein n=1 Tax=Riccia sorocarpa TaxID=122646 RepID=A0ABD3GW89_9MARC